MLCEDFQFGVLNALSRSREVIQLGWTQGSLARTVDDIKVNPNNPAAVKFCLIGALERRWEIERAYITLATRYLGQAIEEQSYGQVNFTKDLTIFNDHPNTTKEMVISVFNQAIEQILIDIVATQDEGAVKND